MCFIKYTIYAGIVFSIITAIRVAKTQSIPYKTLGVLWDKIPPQTILKVTGSINSAGGICKVLGWKYSEPPSPFQLKWQNHVDRNKGLECQHITQLRKLKSPQRLNDTTKVTQPVGNRTLVRVLGPCCPVIFKIKLFYTNSILAKSSKLSGFTLKLTDN